MGTINVNTKISNGFVIKNNTPGYLPNFDFCGLGRWSHNINFINGAPEIDTSIWAFSFYYSSLN